jgi:hypothetical protein
MQLLAGMAVVVVEVVQTQRHCLQAQSLAGMPVVVVEVGAVELVQEQRHCLMAH